jgi:hypothetical protein
MIVSADYIDSCGQLRKLDDALYRMGFAFIAPLPATGPLFLPASLRMTLSACGSVLLCNKAKASGSTQYEHRL